MMEAALPRSWKQEFALAAAMRQEDILYREKMARFEASKRLSRENERLREEKRDRETFDMLRAALATERQVVVFREKLDRYDAKTVEALMENSAALEEAQKRFDDMLGNAHVLPDGRHVFKTRDGRQVFDEHGQAVAGNVIDPDLIGDTRTRWEDFKAADEAKSRLLKERQELIDYQSRLDQTRERLDKGDVTEADLDGFDADLQAAMPASVRAKLGIEEPQQGMGPASPGQRQQDAVRADPAQPQRTMGLSPM